MKICCVFSLESPHRGDSNEYTQYTIFHIQKKIAHFFLNLQLWDCFQGTQERIRTRGKRGISVRATEVLLSVPYSFQANACAGLILQSNARFTHYREADSP